MAQERLCQSCGSRMFSQIDMGREKDGSLNTEYCYDCYKNGQLIDGDNKHEHSFYFGALPSTEGDISRLSEGSSDIGTSFLKL